MKLERNERRIARFFQILQNRSTHAAALRGYRRRIPHEREQGLEVVGQPRALRVGVLDGHENVPRPNPCTFLHRLDADGEAATMFAQDVLPAFTVENVTAAEVKCEQLFCFLDAFSAHDLADQVLLDDVLEPEEDSAWEFPAAAFEEGVHVLRVRRILLPVRWLVAVGVESDVALDVDAVHDDSFQLKLRTERTLRMFSWLFLPRDRAAFSRAARVR